jgi:hypothetical protein
MGLFRRFKTLPLAGKVATISAAAVIMYALLGFLAAPPIIQSVLKTNIKKNLNRDVSLRRLRLNPFALSLTAEGFALYDLDNEHLVSFEKLHVNFQLSSIFQKAYTFDEIRLVAPDISIRVMADGNLSFADLLDLSDQPDTPAPERGALPQVLIRQFAIEKGRLSFTDFSRPGPYRRTFSPVHISLNDFSTVRGAESPYSFAAGTGDREIFSWQGDVSINPLGSSGSFKLNNIKIRNIWDYFQHQLNFEITDGSVSLAGGYEARLSGEKAHIELRNCEIDLKDFIIVEKGGGEKLISLPISSIRGIDVDVTRKIAAIASLYSSDADVSIWLTPEGELNLLELAEMIAPESPEIEDAAEAESPEPDKTDQPEADEWSFVLHEATFTNYMATIEDRRFDDPVKVSLKAIDASIKNVTNNENSPVDVALSLTINESGKIAAEGSVELFPPSADIALTISGVLLPDFNKYVGTVAALDILSGELGIEGRAKYSGDADDAPMASYSGRIAIDNFAAADHVYSDDLLKWESLAFNDMTLEIEPTSLSISEIVIKEPRTKVVIWPDGSLNLAALLPQDSAPETSPDAPEGSEAQAEAASTAPETPAEGDVSIPVTIDTVRVENGLTSFADLSIEPNFTMGIHGLTGTITGLSSESLARADVSLEGRLDEYAPVSIVGQINPLSEDVYTDIEILLDNMELATFTTYSGKYVGYTIEKGKLSLDLKYKVSESILIGENKVVLDQFTFEKRVESPDATSLPVTLAVALLKDRRGVIDIDVPTRGNLDDPEFKYGGIIFRAVMNLMAEAVTSPFALLGNLVGGDSEELNFIVFEFGRSELHPTEVRKLDRLAAALAERPALMLEIKGAADTQYDRAGLAEAKLRDQLMQARLEEMGAEADFEAVATKGVDFSDENYSRLLLQTYIDTFDEDPRILLETEPEPSVESDSAQVLETTLETTPETAPEPMPESPDETIDEPGPPETVSVPEPDESGANPVRFVTGLGRRLVESVQDVIIFGTDPIGRTRSVLRDMGKTPESLPLLLEKAKQRLVENTVIEDLELQILARERANRIKGHLIDTGKVPNEQVFMIEPEIGRTSGGNSLQMDLSLTGR